MPSSRTERANEVHKLVLRRSLHSFFAGEPYLRQVAHRLIKAGVLTVGDLARLTYDDIVELANTTPGNVRRMFKVLRDHAIVPAKNGRAA